MEQEKLLKDIFKNFSNNSNLLNAKIISVNLFKKSNKIDIQLKSDEKIKVAEIAKFEQYIQKEFDIETVVIELKYPFSIDEQTIQEEWSDIIQYVAIKYPLTKAIMKDATLNFENNKIAITLSVKGRDILIARNMDNALADLIEYLYDKRYKIEYIENVSEEKIQAMEEKLKEEEHEAIQRIQNVEKPVSKEEIKVTEFIDKKEERKRTISINIGKICQH